ncbi:MAG: hypothetical protein QOI86_3556 [Actinomycetota bacterium]|nr:hypothetical protein [Actinomycetota bacterium]
MPGLLDVLGPDEPGMHRTRTTDFGIVLSGTVVLELDDEAAMTFVGPVLAITTLGDPPTMLAIQRSSPDGVIGRGRPWFPAM